jgi:hypothetical protein
MRRTLLVALGAIVTAVWVAGAGASTPTTDVRLTNDCVIPATPDPASPTTAPPGYTPPAPCAAGTATPGYVSEYTLATGIPVTNDRVINECSIAHGRQNEPAVQMDPRDPNVILGSSNDYCGVFYTKDASGFPAANGPVWLGYYRSTNGGGSFQSSLVPGYPGDTSPYAALSQARTAGAGDPVIAWDAHGRAFFGSESSGDPAGTKKTFGDVWVATFDNPGGPASANTSQDGLRYRGTTVVAHGSSAPNLLGVFHDKTAIEADHTGTSPCDGDVYFAWARFSGNAGGSNIYFVRSTDHGATFSSPMLLTPNIKNIQDPDISVTGNGHVYVTWDQGSTNSNQTEGVGVAKSVDCGATFSPPTTLVGYTGYAAQDVQDPTAPARPSQPDDPAGDEEPGAAGSLARDCGDFADHCQSGFTFFRRSTDTRSTADQFDTSHEWIYLTFDASRGPILPTGTTYGTISPGQAADTGAYFVRYDGATGRVDLGPTLLDPAGTEQTFPDISADGGILHTLWWDTRNAPADCRSPIRPLGNCSDGKSVPVLDVFAKTSSDHGATWSSSVQLTDVRSNGNWEQFDNRAVPFGGDYLWITSRGTSSFGTWTDWRDTRGGTDAREAPEDEDAATTDVYQCRAVLTSTDKKGNTTSSFSSDRCPHSGGLDQNIYGDATP